jgi:CubicO group peptidase (beta-lactamase class C family)
MTVPEINGQVAPGFEPVRDAFRANFVQQAEVGAACALYLDGECIVDLWGGCADPESGRPWQRDALQLIFSATKAATTVCLLRLVERGEIDLDAPVVTYWPEFEAAGKAGIPVRWLLCHRAGIPVIDAKLTLEEVFAWDPVIKALEVQAPSWAPGTAHGYHARTFGWMVGELVRRVSGRSLGEFFFEEIAGPLGLDFYIGLPESLESRCTRVLSPITDPEATGGKSLLEVFGPDTLLHRVLTGPSGLFGYDEMWNTRALHAAEIPSSNGICDARSLARFYAALIGPINGQRILSAESMEAAREVQAEGRDQVIFMHSRFGLGFMLPPILSPGLPQGCFGHPGAGGSLGFAHPERGLAFGYVMNQMHMALSGDPRSSALVKAVYSCL